jgi:putative N6-adenine-specific DNA methylase
MIPNRYFATCPRGLEQLLADELLEVKAKSIKLTDGGVSFDGDWAVCYAANLHSRIATRILWQVARGKYLNEEDLFEAAYKLNWSQWFDVKNDLNVLLKV